MSCLAEVRRSMTVLEPTPVPLPSEIVPLQDRAMLSIEVK